MVEGYQESWHKSLLRSVPIAIAIGFFTAWIGMVGPGGGGLATSWDAV